MANSNEYTDGGKGSRFAVFSERLSVNKGVLLLGVGVIVLLLIVCIAVGAKYSKLRKEVKAAAEEGTTAALQEVVTTDTPVVSAGGTYIVSTDKDTLNLRAQPNTSSEILAQIAKGTTIYVISVENNWGKVVYDSQTGYVSMTYLTPEQSVTNPIVASNDSNG